jgi:hypothetical protein
VERPVRDKHAGLLQTFVNCGLKKFYNIGSWRRLEPAVPNEKKTYLGFVERLRLVSISFLNKELI